MASKGKAPSEKMSSLKRPASPARGQSSKRKDSASAKITRTAHAPQPLPPGPLAACVLHFWGGAGPVSQTRAEMAREAGARTSDRLRSDVTHIIVDSKSTGRWTAGAYRPHRHPLSVDRKCSAVRPSTWIGPAALATDFSWVHRHRLFSPKPPQLSPRTSGPSRRLPTSSRATGTRIFVAGTAQPLRRSSRTSSPQRAWAARPSALRPASQPSSSPPRRRRRPCSSIRPRWPSRAPPALPLVPPLSLRAPRLHLTAPTQQQH